MYYWQNACRHYISFIKFLYLVILTERNGILHAVYKINCRTQKYKILVNSTFFHIFMINFFITYELTFGRESV